jgi:porin
MMRMGIVALVCTLAAAGGMLRPARAADGTAAQPYAGDVLTRSTLTGDWGGVRDDWAKKGVTFDASVTQVTQGVVSGGKNGSWEYGGRGDLVGNLDTQKLGLWPGGFLNVELEGNWSDAVNNKTGGLNPANSSQLYPLPGGDNVALPSLTFAQFVSHYAGVVVGKLQTISTGDLNEFAHGKGDTQFLNMAFNFNPTLIVVPYSTLGAGAIVLPTADPNQAVVSAMVLSATGKASTDGFDDLNGAIFTGEGRVRTDLFGLTGHQLVGALYSNKSYTSMDQRIEFEPLRDRLGLAAPDKLAKKDGTWAVYYNFDQFLYETDKSAGKGFGLFGRFGASEGNPNPSKYFYSIGFGGKGVIPGRGFDQFGIGYYYDSIENPTLQTKRFGTAAFLRDEWGFEAFYNVALTPWLLLTPDVQVVGPAQKRKVTGHFTRPSTVFGSYIGTATILGLRLQLVL